MPDFKCRPDSEVSPTLRGMPGDFVLVPPSLARCHAAAALVSRPSASNVSGIFHKGLIVRYLVSSAACAWSNLSRIIDRGRRKRGSSLASSGVKRRPSAAEGWSTGVEPGASAANGNICIICTNCQILFEPFFS
jgi:hypothetical protein